MNKKIPIAIAVIALIALSSFCLEGANAQLDDQLGTATNTSELTSRSYIRLNGAIAHWGISRVKGLLQTQAGIGTLENGDTNQFASATAMWTTNLVRPIMFTFLKQDFKYVFYQARLANPRVSELITGSATEDYVLSGTWNLFTVTTTVTFTKNDQGQVTGVHREMDRKFEQVEGELRVTNNYSEYKLSLTGKRPLTGTIARSVIRQVAFNPFKVTDDITTNYVTKADVAAVIRAYGAMPGYGNYNPRMDFRNRFKIDITSLSTVASNM